MKILCDRQDLQEAFAVVGGVSPVKTPKPIVQNVRVRAADDSITLYATDLEMSAKVRVGSVKVKTAGEALLPARETAALLRELSDPTLTLDSKEFRCQLESGSGSFVLVGDDPEQFPKEIVLETGQQFELPAARAAEMIRNTVFAAAREETRYAINGLLFDLEDNTLRVVGTDGRRLAMTYHNLETPAPNLRAIVPVRALSALLKAISDDSDATLLISVTRSQVGFSLGEMQLTSQLLDDRFPDYRNVVPKAADTTIEIRRDLLERNLRKVAVLSSGDVRMVKFNFENMSLKLSAESSGVGRADLAMDVDMQGAGGSISFNPDYLLDALKVCDQEIVRIDMTDTQTPAKFTLGEAYSYILMPISGS